MGSPEEYITSSNQAHMVAAAQEYLQAMDLESRLCHIDVVAVELDKRDELVRLEVIYNAVEL
jgi:Holliday junction resolvase-like predicted endonuclease